jgi:hypothetical protein
MLLALACVAALVARSPEVYTSVAQKWAGMSIVHNAQALAAWKAFWKRRAGNSRRPSPPQ